MIVDLFAGPGGIDHAARSHGIPSTGIEWDTDAVATRHAADLPTIHGDVRNYGPSDVPEATVLTGGPPCQTFTIAGTGTGRAALTHLTDRARAMAARRPLPPAPSLDERSLLALEPLRWILAAADADRPYRAVVLEQVPQALPVWETYAQVLRAEGYSVAVGVLATEEHGLPQTRRRAVLVARRDGQARLPAPTHRPYRKGVPRGEGDPGLLPWRSMGDALPWRGEFTVVSNYGTGGDPRARGRRTSAEPAFTVTGKVSRLRLFDPTGRELPRLTASEAGLLQGFPADWPWSGCGVAQQVGNACPPPLAGVLLAGAGVRLPVPSVVAA